MRPNRGSAAPLAAIAGMAMAYAHSYVPLATVLAVALVTVAVAGCTPRKAVLLGILFGAVESVSFWSFLVSGPVLFAVAALVHTAGRAAFVVALARFSGRGDLRAAIGVPATWVALEWVRTLGPYHPVSIGDGFAPHVWLIQVAALGGTFAVGFVVVAAGHAMGLAWRSRSKRWAAASVAIIGLAATYGAIVVRTDAPGTKAVRVALVQHSVPYWLYDLAYADTEFARIIERTYVRSLDEPAEHTDLLVWPETAVPHGPAGTATIARALKQKPRPDLLAGMVRRAAGGEKYNTAFVVPAEGPTTFYDKRFLVPVMESHLGAGVEATVLRAAGTSIAPAICWESVFPDLVMHAQGAGLIAVLTDPGAFGASDMAELHARKSVLRAVEQGRPTLHASQTGPSWIIDRRGRITASLDSWAVGVVRGTVQPGETTTVFAATRGAFAWIVSLLGLLLLASTWRGASR